MATDKSVPTARQALTRDDARRFIADSCMTPTASPQIGLELEFLSFASGDARPSLDAFGERPSLDGLERIAAEPLPSGGRVTCEPGGQLEVSTTPRATVDAAIAATTDDVDELTRRASSEGIEVRAVGADRWRAPQRLVDSCRYRAMEGHFDTLGPEGRRMMNNTASLQINVGVAPASLQQWRVAHAIGPAMIAAFANSPDDDGRKSTRLLTWLAMEQTRVRAVDDAPDPRDAWADYALAATALVARDDKGECVALPTPMAFADWIERGSEIGYPTIDDLTYHLTMLFPPVRPRGWLELRYLDALPSPWWEVATRVVVALLRDEVADDALRAVAGTEQLWRDAAEHGLDDERLALAADRCFEIATAVTDDAGVAEYAARYVSRRLPAWA